MSPEMLSSLFLFTLVATVTPGGATTLATASGAQFGFRRSVPLLLGIAAGLASLAAAAAAGLAALLQAEPALELALRTAGSAYLLWLAWRIGRSAGPNAGAARAAAPTGFWTGILLLWLNPKGWAMALGAAASFAALSPDPALLALVLGAAFGTAAVASLTLWCVGGLLLARALKTERQWRAVNLLLALLLAASILPMWLG
ncbi:MAG TPA: LysE family transporter [Azospirillaceae bacterium]|nr:LysE family transporter [Azospirillaceae bacterium]